MTKAIDTFQHSPLITPARLDADVHEALRLRPAWAHKADLVADQDERGDSPQWAVVLHASKDPSDKPIQLAAVQAAILYELTRFGGSVLVDTAGGKEYPKLLGHNRKDNVTLRRLWENAGANEDVALTANSEGQRHEHRPGEALVELRSSGRASKAARQIALDDALARATESAAPVFSVASYVANLGALFQRLDGMQTR